jgi:hypothetical protein
LESQERSANLRVGGRNHGVVRKKSCSIRLTPQPVAGELIFEADFMAVAET